MAYPADPVELRGLPVGCHYCRTTKYPWSWYVTRSGEHVRLCDDGTACLRRKMRRDGIKLLEPSNQDTWSGA